MFSFASAQMVYDWETRAENFHYRVKNIEFFLDRFNNQPEGSGSTHAANPKDTAACLAFMNERDAKIFSLFDLSQLDKKDQETRKKINTFFRDINSPYQPKFLRFEDRYWYASLTFDVHSGGEPKRLHCIMQVVSLGQGALGWVIKSFHSSDLAIQDHFTTNDLNFPPSVNGTDFMDVRLALKKSEWLSEKLEKPGLANSKTLKLLREGKLSIDKISNITYHFLQLEGWIMTVEYVKRESKNSGWLIDRLQPATVQEKVKYKKEVLHD